MIPRIEVLEMNWQEHIAEGTTLHDAIKLCIGAVRSRKWRDTKHHDDQSAHVDMLLFYCLETFEDADIMGELFNQSTDGSWIYWLLHDRITLQILLSQCLDLEDDATDTGVRH